MSTNPSVADPTGADPAAADSTGPGSPVQFNLATVFETLAETLGDRECFVWRDRRLSYAQLAERSRRLAAYLHGRGLGVRVPRDATGRPRVRPGPHRVGPLQRERVPRGDAGRLRSPAGPVQRELPLRRRGAALPPQRRPAARTHPPRLPGPDARRGAADARTSHPRSCSRWPTNRGTTCCPARWTTRRRWRRRRPRGRPSTLRPTTSTSSTRVAPRACPRVCCGASTTSSWVPWEAGRWAAGSPSPATTGSSSGSRPPRRCGCCSSPR